MEAIDKEVEQVSNINYKTSYKNSEFYKKFNKQKILLLFILPAFVGVLMFNYLPMYGIIVAFQDFNIIDGFKNSEFVGLKHFKALLGSRDFIYAFTNSIKYAVVRLVVIMPLPIIFALLINELTNVKYKRFIQSISYLPHFVSWVVTAGFVYQLFGSDGTINVISKMLTGREISILGNAHLFPFIYGISHAWKELGYSAIVYLAALSSIDQELYDAGKVDGANRWKLTLNITLPSILPTIAMLFILSVGGFMAVGFDPVWNLQNSVTRADTHIIETYVYMEGLGRGNYSFATAVGLFNSTIAIALVTISNIVSKKFAQTSLY